MNVLTSFDDCFSAETIADVLSVSKRNIESWAKNGKLVPILDPATHKKPYKKEQLIQFPEFSAMFNSSWQEQEKTTPIREFSLVELFAGAGGLALGLEKAGFKSILLNEKDKFACQTLRFNRPEWNVIEDDIANVDFRHLQGKVDLLTGGFPCQPFSYAGKQLGFEDIRGTLVFEMARAIKEIQPKVFLAENVKGLTNLEDVKEGIIASKIAAHAADIAKGIPHARDIDDKMADARRVLDWDAQFDCALDPETAKAIRDDRLPEDDHSDTCSMCGKFCAVRSMNKALAGEHIDIL